MHFIYEKKLQKSAIFYPKWHVTILNDKDATIKLKCAEIYIYNEWRHFATTITISVIINTNSAILLLKYGTYRTISLAPFLIQISPHNMHN